MPVLAVHPHEIAVVWECPTCGVQLAQLQGRPAWDRPKCASDHESVEMEQHLPDRWAIPADA